MPPKTSLMQQFADQYGLSVEDFKKTLVETKLKKRFKDKNKNIRYEDPTQEEMNSFLVLCKQHDLSPLSVEVHGGVFRGKTLTPVVGIDGWLKMINSHPQSDGMDVVDVFEAGVHTACTCTMYRRDRAHPTSVTEYLSECQQNTAQWDKWPVRMLRHKAVIQCSRYTYGFADIVDVDEADRIDSVSGIAGNTVDRADELKRKLKERRKEPNPEPQGFLEQPDTGTDKSREAQGDDAADDRKSNEFTEALDEGVPELRESLRGLLRQLVKSTGKTAPQAFGLVFGDQYSKLDDVPAQGLVSGIAQANKLLAGDDDVGRSTMDELRKHVGRLAMDVAEKTDADPADVFVAAVKEVAPGKAYESPAEVKNRSYLERIAEGLQKAVDGDD